MEEVKAADARREVLTKVLLVGGGAALVAAHFFPTTLPLAIWGDMVAGVGVLGLLNDRAADKSEPEAGAKQSEVG